MTLNQLLTLLRGAILNDRTDRVGGTSDYLWSDETLVTYINEAQRRFATQGLVLRDGTTDEVTLVTLVADQAIYPLHPAVLSVISAKLEDRDADLTRVGHSALAAYRQPSESWIDPTSWNALPAGPTLAYTTDEGLSDTDSDSHTQIRLRVYPTPRADEAGNTIRLRVVRKPIEELRANALGMIPEIPEDYHIDMLDWAAYLALRVVDDDAGSPKRAADFKATFEENVKNARRDVMRKLFAPIEWGFGRGGFAWTGN